MSKQKIVVWSDVDLDGAMCQLMLRWLYKAENIEMRICNVARLREELLKWLMSHKFADYEQVIFADLDTTHVSDLIDAANTTIYDHHSSHASNIYVKAKTNIIACKSAAEVIYRSNKEAFSKCMTAEKMKLLLLVSDFDSYTLELKDSKNLSIAFWSQTGNRVEQFCKDYDNGFRGFTQLQHNAIALYHKKLQDILSNLQLFAGNIKDNKVMSCFCDTAHNDVATHIIDAYKADVVMLVNPKTQTVSFRKHDDCKINLAELAAKLCENGGGHEDAAGGKISEKFLMFTKTLTPYESSK
jgi:oligoribonuclease NrnB/cAMP/cGMP phosphodiesterase (DHH superfamily)